MFFSDTNHPPLKTSNVEHTKIFRNTNPFMDALNTFCSLHFRYITCFHTANMKMKHLMWDIMIQTQSSINLKTQQGRHDNRVKKKTSFKQAKKFWQKILTSYFFSSNRFLHCVRPFCGNIFKTEFVISEHKEINLAFGHTVPHFNRWLFLISSNSKVLFGCYREITWTIHDSSLKWFGFA